MPAIHHATAKKAAKLGLELIVQPDETVVAAVINGAVLATGINAKEALANAEAIINEEHDNEEDEAEVDTQANGSDVKESDDEEATDDEPVERSIVKRKYRKRYQPTNRSCGDELAKLVSAHIRDDDVINEDRLVRFAKANDCWIDSYATLNVGQRRMNVGNRLRAKVRKGHEVIWAM